MRALVLGAAGMLGHELVRELSRRHDVTASVRCPPSGPTAEALNGSRVHVGFDARQPHSLAPLLTRERPDVIVNCVGIVKQRVEALNVVESIAVNSLFPHWLGELAALAGARVVHLSTDCVFSGKVGGYTEESAPDPVDLYGRSKLLGELTEAPGLTLRTSIIGLEIGRNTSLVEWFLSQQQPVSGFTRAIYSGLTTMEMARCIAGVVEDHPDLAGVWHVASDPIDKFTLLRKLAAALGRAHDFVQPDDNLACDRSLAGGLFTTTTGYLPPSWDRMLAELASRIKAREASSWFSTASVSSSPEAPARWGRS